MQMIEEYIASLQRDHLPIDEVVLFGLNLPPLSRQQYTVREIGC